MVFETMAQKNQSGRLFGAAQQRLLRGLILLGVLAGGVQAWAGRHTMWTDGVSYLDMGDAFWRGDWKTAINASWSPSYSWLLGLALLVLKPSAFWEFAAVHLVNFVMFLAALAAFRFLLHESIRYNRRWRVGLPEDSCLGLPDWACAALGYALFFWSSFRLVGLEPTTPDMGVAAFVYLACGLIMRIRRGLAGAGAFLTLGLIVGLGYLAKAAMFPLAFLFLALAWFAARPAPQANSRALLALAAFAVVAVPWIVALSASKGRFTTGDAGRLNYAWHVNRTHIQTHWQGDPPGSGTPLHPTRKIFEPLPVYEFATPVAGTYPPLYDDSYWYEGIRLHFSLREQLGVLLLHARIYVHMLLPGLGGLVVATFLLYCAGRRRSSALRDIGHHWSLLIPAVAALVMYALVHVEGRYIAPFVVLLWMAVFFGVRLRHSPEAKSLANGAAAIMLVWLLAASALPTGRAAYSALFAPQPHLHWQVAEGLRKLGLQPGDPVAVIGYGIGSSWARLARLRIVAELPQPYDFWTADAAVQSGAIAALATTGARALVSAPPPAVSPPGWERIGATDYYVLFLAR